MLDYQLVDCRNVLASNGWAIACELKTRNFELILRAYVL
jgi:hypothetical protein